MLMVALLTIGGGVRSKTSSHNVTITSKKLEKTNLTVSQSSMCGQAIAKNLGRK